MRILIYIVLTLSVSQNAFTQKIWVQKDVGHKINVSFPQEPEYKLGTGDISYVSKTKDCLFMLFIRDKQLPKYGEFLKLPKEQQVKLEDVF